MGLLQIWRWINARMRLSGAIGRHSLIGTLFLFASALRKIAVTSRIGSSTTIWALSGSGWFCGQLPQIRQAAEQPLTINELQMSHEQTGKKPAR
jgi:hypothetical protein